MFLCTANKPVYWKKYAVDSWQICLDNWSKDIAIILIILNLENLNIVIVDIAGHVRKQIFSGIFDKGKRILTIDTSDLQSRILPIKDWLNQD